MVPTCSWSGILNNASGYDDYLVAKKYIPFKEIKAKSEADKIIFIQRGLFYGELNANLRLDYKYRGLLKT